MTVIHELSFLHRILVLATTEWGIRLPNGIPGVCLPKRPLGRVRRLSEVEERRLMSALETSPVLRNIVAFALETGMRRGEIIKIEWDHVDLDRHTLMIPETKTGVPREIPLSQRALEILNRQPNPSLRVFEIKANTLSQAFRRTCDASGLVDLRFHDLRHEATSRFFEKGLNVLEVASITGHRSLEMLNRYTHLKAENLAARL